MLAAHYGEQKEAASTGSLRIQNTREHIVRTSVSLGCSSAPFPETPRTPMISRQWPGKSQTIDKTGVAGIVAERTVGF